MAGEWSRMGLGHMPPRFGRVPRGVCITRRVRPPITPCPPNPPQALADQEAAVVADAVLCVAAVAPHLRKLNLLAAARKVRG